MLSSHTTVAEIDRPGVEQFAQPNDPPFTARLRATSRAARLTRRAVGAEPRWCRRDSGDQSGAQRRHRRGFADRDGQGIDPDILEVPGDAAAKRRAWAWANLMSSMVCSATLATRSRIAASPRPKLAGDHLSKRSDNSHTAPSPRSATSAMVGSTVERILERRRHGEAERLRGLQALGCISHDKRAGFVDKLTRSAGASGQGARLASAARGPILRPPQSGGVVECSESRNRYRDNARRGRAMADPVSHFLVDRRPRLLAQG